MPPEIVSKVARVLPDPVKGALRRGRSRMRGDRPPPPLPQRPPLRESAVRLLIGPANFAGQGWAWGRAVERAFPEVTSQVFGLVRPYSFATDYEVEIPLYRSARWAREQEAYVSSHFTHVLIEAERPILGILGGEDGARDAKLLAEAGVRVAMVSHGSDVRLPSRHVQRYPYSPFTDPDWELVPRLEEQAARFGRIVSEHQGPKFVSTPDLLDDVPDAVWLPVVVDVEAWACDTPLLERERPLVVHAPSNTRFKGTELVEPVLERLHDEGLIEYRRVSGVPHEEVRALFQGADVVLDQFVIGAYSVTACEAMAAGRLVVCHVADHVRARIGQDLPIVEANPGSVESVLRRICAERDWARDVAAQGERFVRHVHDGRRSAEVLGPFLGDAAHADS